MKTFFLNFKTHLFLLLIAMVWLLVVVFIFQINAQTFTFGDSTSYYLAAVDLYQKGILNDHRPLVISAINGLPLAFGFENSAIYTWSLIVNLSCWLATLLLIFTIAKRYVSQKLAFLVSVFFIFCLGNLFITFHLLSETVFTFCLLLVLYLIQKHLETKKINFLIYATSLLILAIMIKPLSLLLVIIILLFFYKKAMKLFTSKHSIVIYLSGCVLLFQLFTLKKEFGNFTVSYIDAFTYYNYLGTRADCLQHNVLFEQGKNERYVYFSTLSPSQQKEVAAADFKQQLTNNTVNLGKAYFINLWINATKGSASVFGCENKANTSYFIPFQMLFKSIAKVQNIVLTSIGLALSLLTLVRWKRADLFFKISSIVILYVVIISAISSDQGDRFHIVLYPIILLLLAHFYQKKQIHD
ncbi:MAG: hypothetical protein V4648_00045 [Bacteroidota bacterium]